ncbi:MAG TPA: hypothetical protein VIA45_16620 [Thermoanaerobaculia bacterium]|jgi:hypothetical protein
MSSDVVAFALIAYFIGRGKMLSVWIPLGVLALLVYAPRKDRMAVALIGLAAALVSLLVLRRKRLESSSAK